MSSNGAAHSKAAIRNSQLPPASTLARRARVTTPHCLIYYQTIRVNEIRRVMRMLWIEQGTTSTDSA